MDVSIINAKWRRIKEEFNTYHHHIYNFTLLKLKNKTNECKDLIGWSFFFSFSQYLDFLKEHPPIYKYAKEFLKKV